MKPIDMTKLARLKWATVTARWATHDVPLVTVVNLPQPRMHEPPRWMIKGESSPYSGFSKPTCDTAYFLAARDVMQTPEKYAAFALLAFVKEWGSRDAEPSQTLSDLARDVSAPGVTGTRLYWHHRATHVLPWVEDEKWFNAHEAADWELWVDAAADLWKSIAATYGVARWPSDDPPAEKVKAVLPPGHCAEILSFPTRPLKKPPPT